ncbi:MAG: porin [Thiohalomonadales bacterium]
MNNKLIALAVAAAITVPTVATAAPTVGGIIQVEIANVSNDGYGENNGRLQAITKDQSATKVKDNKRGRLWFKGSEDLGGKLKANYKFEWQINSATGSVNDGARESWVGLSGGFGAFEVGRIKSSYKYTGGVKYDPFVTTYMEARKSGGMIGGDFGQNSFWSYAASYKIKSGPHRFWINVGLDGGDQDPVGGAGSAGPIVPDFTNNEITPKLKKAAGSLGDIAASYLFNAGSWEVFGAYGKDDSMTNAENGNDARTLIKGGGKIKFGGAHSIAVQYEQDDRKGPSADSTLMFLGYQFKMGKTVYVAQIGQTDHDNDANDTDYYALGVIHKFSKTTRTFIGYRVSDKTNAATAGVGSKNDLSVLSLGLRVAF